MSYSSRIGPTISSMRSSKVTIPAVPPCSSTTIAMCTFRSFISRSSSPTCLASGVKYGSRAIARQRALIVAVDAVAQQVLRVDDADDVVDVLLVDRDARVSVLDDDADHVGDRIRCSRRRRRRRAAPSPRARLVGHLEDAVDHLPLLLLDDPLLLADVEQQLQLLLCDERPADGCDPWSPRAR